MGIALEFEFRVRVWERVSVKVGVCKIIGLVSGLGSEFKIRVREPLQVGNMVRIRSQTNGGGVGGGAVHFRP